MTKDYARDLVCSSYSTEKFLFDKLHICFYCFDCLEEIISISFIIYR